MISVCFQGKPFIITVIQVYALTSNAEEAEVERFYEDLPTRPFRTNTQKRCPFHYRGLECKGRKSRNTWSNRKIWPCNMNEAGQRLIEFCQKNSLVITNTLFQQHMGSAHGHHQMINTKIILIIFFAAKDGEALYSQQKQDWELTVAQIMNSLLPNSDLN